eukprot:Gb_35200 [translate_table: standard]
MAVRKQMPLSDAATLAGAPSAIMPSLARKTNEEAHFNGAVKKVDIPTEEDVDIDLREVYFLIMHFLSGGPCHRTCGQLWNELLEHKLLPRRYHAWYSRKGRQSGDEDDDGLSFPLSYVQLVERYPHIEKDHLVKLLQQLLLKSSAVGAPDANNITGADVPTLLGAGAFSLLESERGRAAKQTHQGENYLRWPHMQANQVHGLSLREIGGGFAKHHRAPSVRAACYAIAKPSTLLQKIQIIKKLRGHQNAVYCAIFDRSGQYVITGSDDRLVKIWSMETGFCLSSCRGHEGDITDLAVSSNNALVASASNDCIIRVWRLPDGLPISVLRGHTGAVTAIAFSPRPGCEHHLLSSSDDGTCRIWDARDFHINPRIYVPKPEDNTAGAKANGLKVNDPAQFASQRGHQILCCAFNANGTIFVTGSSDTLARVWSACRWSEEVTNQPNHELDTLSGHENDVNYVQFSGSAVPARIFSADSTKEENLPKFKNSWFTHDNIVTCSRDGSAIIWVPRSRRSHGRVGRWTRAYHLRVPPPPMPPQPPRGGPRQRLLPTPRGVNMIVWSLDNRFVLAAIMDCRICVWNAVDGSLVHSLTGHTESTYVLDVHPFNPRIAMSAGYDGKTIIWDIWEGVPIRIYETGHFKLVDGKFSPDGTSIVLSDEVGQIYILATGQGESQKDAKYDQVWIFRFMAHQFFIFFPFFQILIPFLVDEQFFLGDYRPLIQDVHGNVLDQETQLPPYRRNIQDLLCDANMIPYPDPYQNMYQQRRLGALGIDWQPPSVRLAVGTIDDGIYAIQDDLFGQLPPTNGEGDRDRWLEQPAELEDGMDWEQENDAQSDDTGSEYNVTDECTSEGEKGSLNVSSSEESECSVDEDENSKDEESSRAHLRRSKRKKRKAEGIMVTSCGRRVRKKNVHEGDGTRARIKKIKHTRNGLSVPRESEKSSRPQRLAARNALNLFSRIGEGSTEEDEELNEGDNETQGSGYSQPEGNALSNESQRSSRSGKQNCFNDEEKSQDELEPMHGDLKKHTGSEKKILLKFPLRDLRKLVLPESTKSDSDVPGKTGSPSIEIPLKEEKQERAYLDSLADVPEDKLCGKGYLDSATTTHRQESVWCEGQSSGEKKEQEGSGHDQEHHRDLSLGYEGKEIRWGEVKTRTSKRLRVGDVTASDICVKVKDKVDSCSAMQGNAHQHLNSRALMQSSLNCNGQRLRGLRKGRNAIDLSSQSGQEDHQGNMTRLQNLCTASSSEDLDIAANADLIPERRETNASTEHDASLPENPYADKASASPTPCNGSGTEANWRVDNGYLSDKSETSIPKDLTDNNYNEQAEMAETVADNGEEGKLNHDRNNYLYEAAETKHSSFGKFKSRSRRTKKDSYNIPHEPKHANVLEDCKDFGHEMSFRNTRPAEEKFSGKFQWRDASTSGHCLQPGDGNIQSGNLEYYNDDDIGEIGLHAGRMGKAVYKNEKLHAEGENSEGMVQNSSNEDKQMSRVTLKLHPMSTDGSRRTRSKRIKTVNRTGQEADSSFKHHRVDEGYSCEERSTRLHKRGSEARESALVAEWGTASRVSGGSRPGRNKKGTGFNNIRIPVEKKKGRQSTRKLSWLMLDEVEEGNRYIPQFGDEVVYLRQGHQEFLEMSNLQERGPWKSVKGSIQAVEICRVDGLEYSTLAGSGDTCCKLTLKFIDPGSKVFGKNFKLTLPELTDFPDFLVEKSRYDAAVKRNWTHRDKCEVWWRTENGEGGSWWEGRVIAVKPKSSEFLDSPWDRYVVQYKGDSTGPHTHSPWELFDPDNHTWEQAQIDSQIKSQLLHSITEVEQISLENEDYYGLAKLSQVSGKSDFHNRIPLPLSVDLIKRRLLKYYYRTFEAFEHDFHVMLANAQYYFGKDVEMTLKLQRLKEWLSGGLGIGS